MKKWQEFEELVHTLQKELVHPDTSVLHDQKIDGKKSKTKRQVDLLIEKHIGQYKIRIIIECKDHNKPVDTPTVESFVTKLRDVEANKGVMVSSQGFTKSALVTAKEYGVDTLKFVDTKSKDWGAYVAIQGAVRDVGMNYRFIVSNIVKLPKLYLPEIQNLSLYVDNKKTRLGTVQNVLLDKWNSDEIPNEVGVHTVLLAKEGWIGLGDDLYPVKIEGEIHVSEKYYYGPLPVDLIGFHDEQGGGVQTRQITTKMINVQDLLNGKMPNWKEIDDIESLAVKPHMVFDSKSTFDIKENEQI